MENVPIKTNRGAVWTLCDQPLKRIQKKRSLPEMGGATVCKNELPRREEMRECSPEGGGGVEKKKWGKMF